MARRKVDVTTSVCDLTSLARSEVRTLPLYAPDVTACAIDVSDNVNLWGMPPAALRALTTTAIAANRYPSVYAEPLRDAVLRYLGLSNGSGIDVVAACGSDDVLDATMRAFGEPGDEIVFAAPTFAMIPVLAQLNGLVPIAVPMTGEYEVDPQQLVDRRAKITYLCTPNNPTSTALSRAAVEYVVHHAAGLVVIDEAYVEFAPESFVALVATSDRLVVTRTFSKAFGLAGLRVGYGIGSAEVLEPIVRARGPYKVNALAEAAAVAALGDGPDGIGWVAEHAALVVANRERFTVRHHALRLSPAPAAGNFVFVPVARAQAVADGMRRRDVLVRALSDLPQDVPALAAAGGQGLRIGIGPWATMERVLEALEETLACV
jgi:histidinol-phosphate aminotransferase